MRKNTYLIITGSNGSSRTKVFNILQRYNNLLEQAASTKLKPMDVPIEVSSILLEEYIEHVSWLLVIDGSREFSGCEREWVKNFKGSKSENLFVVFIQRDSFCSEMQRTAEESAYAELGGIYMNSCGAFQEALYYKRVFFLDAEVKTPGNNMLYDTGILRLRHALTEHLSAWKRASGFLEDNLKRKGTISDEAVDILCRWPYINILGEYQETGKETVIAFCGGFNTGKSTLINKLTGEDILPTKFTTATSAVTRIEYGERFEIFSECFGERRKISPEEARQEILYSGRQDFRRKAATAVIFKLPNPMLKNGVVLVDTPGIDDDERLTEISIRQLKRSSLCVILFTAERFNKMSDKQLYEYLNKEIAGNVVFVVNKCDLIHSPQEFQRLLEYEKAVLSEMGNQIVGKGTVFNTCCKDEKAADLDGFDKWLGECIGSMASDLQRNARMAHKKSLCEALFKELTNEINMLNERIESRENYMKLAAREAAHKAGTKISVIRKRLTSFQIEQMEQLSGITAYISKELKSYKAEFNRAMLQRESLTPTDTFEWRKDMLISVIFPSFFENVQEAFEEIFPSGSDFFEGLSGELVFPALPDSEKLILPGEIPEAEPDKSSYGWLFGSVCYLVGSFDNSINAVRNKLVPRSENFLRDIFQRLEKQIEAMEKDSSEDSFLRKLRLMRANNDIPHREKLQQTYNILKYLERDIDES